MAIKTGAIKAGGSEVYPHTALDQIRKSATSSTTLIAPGGVIQKDYLELTGLISSSYVSSANIIPASAINGFVTSAKNVTSTYVHSASVIPQSAINGLAASLYDATDIIALAGWAANATGLDPQEGDCYYNTTDNLVYQYTNGAWEDFEASTKSKLYSYGGILYHYYVVANMYGLYQMDYAPYHEIITIPTGTATVTIEPGKAYKIDATTSSKTLAINSYNAGLWGRESHIELFVANTGYVHVGSDVTLVDALEPDAVNNLTVRFHDAHAIISVEDHTEAYMVNNTDTGSATSGTLAYGLKQTGNTYQFIGFRSELNTRSVPTGGATATILKHIVGNGMDVGPTISGNLIVKSGATIRDVKLSGVTVTSGAVTFADVFIPNGSTVTFGTGGYMYPTFVYGDGGVIDLNQKTAVLVVNAVHSSVYISGCTITNGSAGTGGGGAMNVAARSAEFVSCVITGNTGSPGGGLESYANGTLKLTSCIVSGNTSGNGAGLFTDSAEIVSCIISGNVGGSYDIRFTSATGHVSIKDSTIGTCAASRGILTLGGSNRIDTIFGAAATVNILSGTSITLTALAIAAIAGIVLNAILPGNDYEFGKNPAGDQSRGVFVKNSDND
jgi:hypothetical protein